MQYDALIETTQSAWGALLDDETIDGNVYRRAVTGFWQPSAPGLVVWNIRASSLVKIAAFKTALGIDSVPGQWEDNGLDAIDPDTGDFLMDDPDKVLALQRDIEELDEDGEIVGSHPATQDEPNWGHVFAGQRPRSFGGDFSADFSEDFH